MALRVVASRPDPSLLPLPWNTPLASWHDDHLVGLPRGLSRHVVRIIRTSHGGTYVAKETETTIALREYRLLRELTSLRLPVVEPQGVITGRENDEGDPLPAVLITRHLQFSLPYRWLFTHGVHAGQIPELIDALVVLLVRLHLANFYWGDVSLSNVLFRRAAGEFAAYLVDAETGELRETLSQRMREHDVTVGCENVFAELMDLQASGEVDGEIDGLAVINLLRTRYELLWSELTGAEEFDSEELWRVEQRIARLNELGFDVDEIEMVEAGETDPDSPDGAGPSRYRLQPKVVELGHHARELQGLTGLNVEENQARRLLNDLASYTASVCAPRDDDAAVVANNWFTTIYKPITALVPRELRAAHEPPEIFHEILEHRWYLSEIKGSEVDIFEAADDYVDRVLPQRPSLPATEPPPEGAP